MKRVFIFVLVFLLSISYITAATTFPASNVSIKIDGTDRTLQYAVNNGLLKGMHTLASASLTAIGQHDASQILVNVNGVEKTLLNALSSGFDGICGSGSYSTYSSSNIPNPGHVATEVILSSGTNLQQAINAGNFCTIYSYSWITGSWTACPSSCGGSHSRTVYCRRNDGATVADSFCPAATKPSSTTACSCRYVDHGYSSCDVFIFWDTCLPGLACSTPSSPPSGGWHCLFSYPGPTCGFMSMTRSVLSCENA